MILSLHVSGAPYSTQSHYTALNYVKSGLQEGHTILRIFFSGEAVNIANTYSTPAQDEENLLTAWSELANEHQFELIICVAAALREGVLDDTEADRYEKEGYNCHPPFLISGLGQLVEAAFESDRIITFGS